jgi:hypothetical protein
MQNISLSRAVAVVGDQEHPLAAAAAVRVARARILVCRLLSPLEFIVLSSALEVLLLPALSLLAQAAAALQR